MNELRKGEMEGIGLRYTGLRDKSNTEVAHEQVYFRDRPF
jgi:hypothetical protein